MNKKLVSSRRGFLEGLAACVGTILLFAAGKPASAKEKEPLTKPEPLPSSRGYRLTEHIKRYYETARR